MRKPFSFISRVLVAMALMLLAVGSPSAVVSAQITYGTLDNFDVINDTGGDCHGFEIELEGISASDVAYTFGAPYQRYGDPVVVPTVTGVIIRYAANYVGGAWSAGTPYTAPPYLPTQGHSCWTGGVADPAEYYASGCDHFGASLNASPTKTTYRWLVEGAPGTLTVFGTNVSLPAPVWNVTPPAPGGQPIAAAVIAPPPLAPGGSEFGEAIWAKVFVTELPDGVQADDLDQMVIDHPDVDIVPSEPAEVEIEWVLLQASTENEGEQEFGGAAEVGAGNEAVSRRFEFYQYAGYYDPDTHEARCDNPLAVDQQVAERCGDPDAEGVAGVGVIIGAQNIAINLAGAFAVPNRPPVPEPDSVSTDEDQAVTINPDDLLLNDADPDGHLLTVISVQDATGGIVALTGGSVLFTPNGNFHGTGGFTYTVDDSNGGTGTAAVEVTIASVNDAPVADAGPNQIVKMRDTVTLTAAGSADVDGDSLTYQWSLAVPKGSKAVLINPTSASPTFVADRKGTYVARLIVNDGLVDSIFSEATIEATAGKK